MRFAADLTGKGPDDFEAIIGTREVSEPSGTASGAEAEMSGFRGPRALNQALTGDTLRLALAPVFSFYGKSCESSSEAEVLAALYETLSGRPYVNQLVKAAAGSARRTRRPRSAGIPGSTQRPDGRCEALLTVGTLARAEARRSGPRADTCSRNVPRPARSLCLHQSRVLGAAGGPGEPAVLGQALLVAADALRRLRSSGLRDRLLPQLR